MGNIKRIILRKFGELLEAFIRVVLPLIIRKRLTPSLAEGVTHVHYLLQIFLQLLIKNLGVSKLLVDVLITTEKRLHAARLLNELDISPQVIRNVSLTQIALDKRIDREFLEGIRNGVVHIKVFSSALGVKRFSNVLLEVLQFLLNTIGNQRSENILRLRESRNVGHLEHDIGS